MTTVTPPGTPTVDVGNEVMDLSGIDTWSSVAQSGTSFTIDSPFSDGEGTRLVVNGTFTGTEGNMPASGTITSIEIWYTYENGNPAQLSSTWVLGASMSLDDFQSWIATDNGDPPAEGETGAGAALFINALFGGDDTLTGTAFNDDLFGNAGADILISGGIETDGDEFLYGEAGNDTIRIQGDYGDFAEISGGADTDTLEIVGGVSLPNNIIPGLPTNILTTNISGLNQPTGVLEGIEKVTFAAAAASQLFVSVEQITGGGLANGLIVTGDEFNNLFTIVVTDGNVAADLDDSYDLAILTDPLELNYTFAGFDGEDYVNFAVGDNASTQAYHLYGNDLNNMLVSALGNDVLLGRDGDDVLFSGFGVSNFLAGVDTLNGGAGDDTIISVIATGDTLIGGTGGENEGDTLQVWGAQAFTSNFNTAATLSGFENLTFKALPGFPSVTGMTAVFNSSQIGPGLATTLHVTGTLTTTDKINIVMNGATVNVSGWTFDAWTGADEVDIDGTSTTNTITGSLGRDNISGAGGADTINGGAGIDTISGGDANDTINGGAGGDALDGGAGSDTASYATSTLGVTVNLTADTASGGDAAGDNLNAIENLLGSNAKDTFTGSSAANTLNGGGGNDVIKGEGGADKVLGGDGADTLTGGLGKDALTGGAGADKFVFNVAATAANVDKIIDFTHGSDTIQLDNAIFAALGGNALNLAAAKFWVGAAAHDASDRIIYDNATGKLYYDADGNAAGAKVLIATLEGGLTLTASDFQVI